jgi:prepilin-type N-terminal cleavage/methylation domain-containing protein
MGNRLISRPRSSRPAREPGAGARLTRARPRFHDGGFTLIEIIAAITIVAILAAVAIPRMPVAQPYEERGSAESLAASLRQSRAVAIASGCDVQFTLDAAGYRATQRVAGTGNHCAASGAFSTPVRRGDGDDIDALLPPNVAAPAGRQFVFRSDGSVAGGAFTISVGPLSIAVEDGVVSGP